MCYKLSNWAKTAPCPSTEKVTLMYLSESARKDSQGHYTCWPSTSTIARDLRLHRRTVRRHIAALKAKNLLQVVPRYKALGQTSNMYILKPSDTTVLPPRTSKPHPLGHQSPTKNSKVNRKVNGNIGNGEAIAKNRHVSGGESVDQLARLPALAETKLGEQDMSAIGSKTVSFILDEAKKPKSVEDIRLLPLKTSEKYSGPKLSRVWTLYKSACKQSVYHRLLGNKEVAQLKMVCTKVENHLQGGGTYDVHRFLETVVFNWIDVAKFAKTNEGAFDIPNTPQVGFLLRFISSALEYADKKFAAKQPVHTVSGLNLTKAKDTSNMSKDDAPTVQDIDDILNDV